MTGEAVSALLVVLVGAPLVTLLNIYFSRRKSIADTESVQVKTALELNGGLRQEIGELRAVVAEQRQRTAAVERRERLRARRDAKHEAWDFLAVSKLREHGIELPDPPSLSDEPDPAERTRAEDFGLPGTDYQPRRRRGERDH
jgi:hypothetical protein